MRDFLLNLNNCFSTYNPSKRVSFKGDDSMQSEIRLLFNKLFDSLKAQSNLYFFQTKLSVFDKLKSNISNRGIRF